MARWIDRLPASPVPWLLEKACPPLRFRTLTEVLGRPSDDWDVQRSREQLYSYPPALAVSRLQQEAGTWLGKVLEFEPPNPSRKRGPAMVNQFLALVEYGWDLSHPICHCSGELLQQYLAENPNAELYELNGYIGENKVVDAAVRRMLARIAAALLARAGMRDDPKLDAYADRLVDELEAQYRDPAGGAIYDGTVEIPEDATYRRMKADALPPDMFTLYVLAFLPRIRASARGRAAAAKVVDHLFAAPGEPRLLVEVEHRRLMKLRLPRISDMTREGFADHKLGYLLHDLELLARTGTLLTHPKAVELLEWILTLPDPDGVFRTDAEIEKFVTPSQYHYFPLEDSWRGKHKKYTDVTFRVLLILSLLDREA